METEKVRVSIGYPYLTPPGKTPSWIALLFAFSYQDPLDLRISWVAGSDHEARYVVDVLRTLCAPHPEALEIDEEGEFVYLRPSRVTDELVKVGFDLSGRREPRPSFDVIVPRSALIEEARLAVERFCDHDFIGESGDNDPARIELLALAAQIGS